MFRNISERFLPYSNTYNFESDRAPPDTNRGILEEQEPSTCWGTPRSEALKATKLHLATMLIFAK